MYVNKFLVKAMPALEPDCQNYARQSKRKCHCFGKKIIWCDGYTAEISEKVFLLSEFIHNVVSFMDMIPQEE